MAAISLAVAAVALLGAVVTKVATGGLRDYGLAERLTIYPVYGWVALMGLVFILLSGPKQAMSSVDPSGSTIETSERA